MGNDNRRSQNHGQNESMDVVASCNKINFVKCLEIYRIFSLFIQDLNFNFQVSDHLLVSNPSTFMNIPKPTSMPPSSDNNYSKSF